jgi:hypothetical protein
MTTRFTALFSKASALCAIALVAALAGCDDNGLGDNVGKAKMSLSLPNGSTINKVSYSITGNGIMPISGTVDISTAGSKV